MGKFLIFSVEKSTEAEIKFFAIYLSNFEDNITSKYSEISGSNGKIRFAFLTKHTLQNQFYMLEHIDQ